MDRARQATARPLEIGCIVRLRYLDHVLYRDANPSDYQPWIRETLGWLDFQNDEYVRLVWERFSEPGPDTARTRASGLTICRKTILEMERVG